MDIHQLRAEHQHLRKKWCDVRDQRLARKEHLTRSGHSIQMIRKDKEYRLMKKEQRKYTTAMRHLEKKINRFNAADNNEK